MARSRVFVDRFGFFLQIELRLQGHAHAFGRVVALGGRRNDAIDQPQVRYPLWQGPSQYQRDDGAQGMPQQGETLQAQLFGDLQHIMGIVPQGVAGTGRPMPRMAMTGHVQGNDPQALEPGGQAGETVGVVQPAMQGDHRSAIFRSEQVGRQLDVGQAQANFFDAAHALRSCQR